jgi:hypothetical protein
MKTGDSKPEAFVDEDVNGSGSLSGLEPSAEQPGPALSAPPIKGVLRKKGGGGDSDSEGDDEMRWVFGRSSPPNCGQGSTICGSKQVPCRFCIDPKCRIARVLQLRNDTCPGRG